MIAPVSLPVLTCTRHVLDTESVNHAGGRVVSIQEQGRTRFIRALSAAIDIPESDIRLRIRAVSEAGLLQKHNEPFLPEHGIAILLSLMVSPTHAEAGRMVPRYAALPNAGVGDLDDRAILTKRQDEAVRRVLPEAFEPGATFGSVLAAVLRDLAQGEANARYFVRQLAAVWPPYDAAMLAIEPVGVRPPVPLFFCAQPPGLWTPMRMPRAGVSIPRPGRVLAELAPYVFPSIGERKATHETVGEIPSRPEADRRVDRRSA